MDMVGWFIQMDQDMKDFLKKMSIMEQAYYLMLMDQINLKENLRRENSFINIDIIYFNIYNPLL